MRILLLGWLVVSPWPAQAGLVELQWQWTGSNPRGTQFLLQVEAVTGGRVLTWEQPLDLRWSGGSGSSSALADICQRFRPNPAVARIGVPFCDAFTTDIQGIQRPCDGTPWMVGACEGGNVAPASTCTDPALAADPTQFCAQACLEPGVYTLQVVAVQSAVRSSASPRLDMDLTGTPSCQPVPSPAPRPPVAQAPPDSSEGKRPRVPLVLPPIPVPGSGAPPSLPNLPNLACVGWKVEGPCFCNPTTPCTTVSYWEPAYIAETVKRPGTTALAGAQLLLDAATSNVTTLSTGGAPARTAGGSTINLHYNEVHLYAYPQLLGGPCSGCAPSERPLTLHYASEVDPAWRTPPTGTPSPVSVLVQIGVWAPLFPRSGPVMHGSEPVSSGVAAARAMSIAVLPVSPPPTSDAHVVLMPASTPSVCCQMAWPKQTGCMPVGTPPQFWETAAVSGRGTYLWIFWVRRSCCVPPNQVTCGLTLIGGQGGNTCIVP